MYSGAQSHHIVEDLYEGVTDVLSDVIWRPMVHVR